jgi:hypothetical protein
MVELGHFLILHALALAELVVVEAVQLALEVLELLVVVTELVITLESQQERPTQEVAVAVDTTSTDFLVVLAL